MRPRSAFVLAPAVLLGVAVAACGGSGDEGEPSALAGIATATAPATLPEPILLGGAPEQPGDGSIYEVRDGDSLSAIAERFGTTVEALVEANAIADPTQLEVGQVLVLPGGPGEVLGATPAAATPTVAPGPTAAPTVPAGETTYTVLANDNAATIAETYGITLDELAAANNTTIDDLRSLDVGVELIIPAPTQ